MVKRELKIALHKRGDEIAELRDALRNVSRLKTKILLALFALGTLSGVLIMMWAKI